MFQVYVYSWMIVHSKCCLTFVFTTLHIVLTSICLFKEAASIFSVSMLCVDFKWAFIVVVEPHHFNSLEHFLSVISLSLANNDIFNPI